MNFEELCKEIEKQKKYANDDLSDATHATLNSRIGRKKTSALRLNDLFTDYRNVVRSRIFPIIAVGDDAEEFALIAKNSDAKLDSINFDLFFDSIINKIDDRNLDGGSNSSYIIDVASRYLEDIALDIGVQSYNQIQYFQKYGGKISTKEQAKDLIKRVINEQVGEELNALFLLDHSSRIAFSEDFSGKLFPILIHSKEEAGLAQTVSSFSKLGIKPVVISTGGLKIDGAIKVKDITEESVIEALKKVKQKASKGQ